MPLLIFQYATRSFRIYLKAFPIGSGEHLGKSCINATRIDDSVQKPLTISPYGRNQHLCFTDGIIPDTNIEFHGTGQISRLAGMALPPRVVHARIVIYLDIPVQAMMRNQLFSFLISRVLGPGTVPVGVVHGIGKPVSPEVSRIIRAKSLIDRSRGSPL